MAKEFIPEGFEVVEEQKEKEIIPGFEVVEKTKVVAEGAAPAAAGESSSMDSTSDDTLSEFSTENLEKKDKKKKDKKPEEKTYITTKINGKETEVEIDSDIDYFSDHEDDYHYNQQADQTVDRIIKETILHGELTEMHETGVESYYRTDGFIKLKTEDLPELMEDLPKDVLDVPEDMESSISEKGLVPTRNKDYYLQYHMANGKRVYANEPIAVNRYTDENTLSSSTEDILEINLITAYNKEKDPQVRMRMLERMNELNIEVGDQADLSNRISPITITEYEAVQADPFYFQKQTQDYNSQIEEQKAEINVLENSKDVDEVELKLMRENLVNLQQYRNDAIYKQGVAQYNLQIIKEAMPDEPKPNAVQFFPGGKRFADYDENGNIVIKSKSSNSGYTDSTLRGFINTKPKKVSKHINSNYLNWGIGADYDGDILTVYKNPVFYTEETAGGDKSLIGKINPEATWKNNYMKDPSLFVLTEGKITTKYLKEKGLAESLDLEGSVALPWTEWGVDAERQHPMIKKWYNWIDDNISDTQLLPGTFAYDQKKTYSKYAMTDEIKEVSSNIKQNINLIQKEVKDSEKKLEAYKEKGVEVLDLKKKIEKKFDKTKSKIDEVDSDNSILNDKILNEESYKKLVEEERKRVVKLISEDPDNEKKYIKQFNDWNKNLIKEQEDLVEDYNNNISKRDTIKKRYDRKSKSDFEKFAELNKEKIDQGKEIDEISALVNQQLNDINALSAAQQSLIFTNANVLKKFTSINENAIGQGNHIDGIRKAFADQFAAISVGRVEALADVADVFNEVEYFFTGKEGVYNYNKNKINADRKSLKYQKEGISDVIAGDVDDNFYNHWSQTTIGGTLQALTQMVASSMGAPVSGMAGGYFLSSLHEGKEKTRQMETDFIKNQVKNGVSRKDAQAMFDEKFPPGQRDLYAYTQATVEGAFGYVTGKIMKGGGPLAGATKRFTTALTNKIVSQMTGKMTARQIQNLVYKNIGNFSSKVIQKGGMMTAVGIEEMMEEIGQEFAAMSVDKLFELTVGNGVDFENPMDFSDPNYVKQFKHMCTVAFLSGNAGGLISAATNNKQLMTFEEMTLTTEEQNNIAKFREEAMEASRSEQELEAELMKLKQKNENGDIDDKTFIETKQALEINYKTANEVDKTLNGTAQSNQQVLLKEIEDLKNQIIEGNDSANKRIENKIKEKEAIIADISNDYNNKKLPSQENRVSKAVSTSGQIVLNARIAKDQEAINAELDLIEESGGIVNRDDYKINPKDFEVEIFSKENAQAIADKYNIDVTQLMDENGNFLMEGSYLPNEGVILLNDQAGEDIEIHEATHLLLDQALEDPNNDMLVEDMSSVLLKEMYDLDPKMAQLVEKQIEKYDTDKEKAEEIITYYAQLKSKGKFKKDKSSLDKLADYTRRLFQNTGVAINVNENNVSQFIDDYVTSLEKGKLTRSQKRALKGEIKFDIKEQKAENKKARNEEKVNIKKAKPISIDTSSMSNTFDQNITEDLITNEDFKNSDAAINAYTAIDSNPQFNSYVNQLINRDANLQGLDSEVKQEINRKIKENLQLRALNNFKPVVDGNRRSLFSYLYGKADQRGLGGVAQKALLDVKKEYATRADAGAISTDVTDSEGRSFDIADTSTDIIEDVDRGVAEAPRSTFRRNIVRGNEKGLTPKEVKSFKEVTQPIVDKLPSVDDKKYRTKVDQVSGKELKSWVKENILKGQDYKTFIKDNYNNIRDLDLKYLIELDKGLMKQGKERMFTKPNRRLTTQADIRKYRDSGRAFVENEAQGVMLYDVLDPGVDAVVDFYTNQTPQNVSNRKGKFMEAIGKKMFKDVLPETRVQRGDTDQVKATSARKTQVQPTLKFAKPFINNLKNIAGLRSKIQVANYLGFDGSAINEKGRQKFIDQMLDAATKGQIDVATIESALMMSGGKETFYGAKDGKKYRSYGDAVKNGIKSPLKFAKRSNGEYVVIAKPNLKNGKVIYASNEAITNEVKKYNDYIPKTGRLYWGAKDPNYIALLETAKKSPFNSKYKKIDPMRKGRNAVKKLLGLEKSQEELNMDMLDHVVNQLAKSVNQGMSMDVAGLIVIQSYQATSGLIKAAAPFKYMSDTFESGNKKETRSSKLYREEHNPPASVVGASILYAVKNNQPKAVMKDIRNNFYQTILSKKDDSLLDVKYAATLPEGTYIGDNPIIRMAMSGINLNTVKNIETGQSIVDEFGLGVAETVQDFPNVFNLQNKLVEQVVKGEIKLSDAQKQLAVYSEFPNNGEPSLAKTQNDANKTNYAEMKQSKVLNVNEEMDMETLLSKAASIDEALRLANSLDQPVKKIRVFDFDDTLATSKNLVFYTSPDGKSGQLNAEEFAKRGLELKEQGYEFDFSDFNKVTDGGRGPLFDIAKKIEEARGNEDLFVLTARAPQSADAIYEFLKAEGLEFKRENIIGLGNSTGEAKANWIVDKAAEGYNDFYFADDAYQNVKAVRNALSVIDVKSKVQQARIKESKKLDVQFNKLLEETTGVEFFKEYSPAKARTIGASKGKFKFFIPHSAEDFLGLIYPTLGKGKLGDRQMAWYKKHLIDPYTKAQESLSAARLNLMNDFKQLKKSLNVPKDLRKKNSTGMTNEQAVRVYLFQSMGYEVPGLSKTDLKELQSVVEKDPKLKTFAEQILSITKGDGYSKPRPEWLTGTITTDLIDLINTEKRSKYLADWQENVDAIYSKENLNKLEAIYGTKYREALEGILRRMKSGRNRLDTGNRLSNKVLDYINGSIGTIMFFNTRSAVLQTISSINFINWNFNNPIKAGAAMANQPQYWKDFVKLMNSDYLKDRRNGLKLNISESEIADAAATSKNKAKAAINYILQKGYLPTQYADSFAIASGGATFYRNRIKDLMKNNGMTEAEAEAQALIEWRQVAEESQQSSDPSRISAQQSSDLGRIILAFANTPMQYARIQKRAIQDLINGRGDAKTHVSKIIYYGFVQNIIFNALQQAVFALGFGDDDEEEDSKKQKKYMDTANGMLDSLLRGLGIAGQAVSVGKNFLMDIYERSGRDRPEYVDAVWKLTQFSPPISSKISKLKQAAWHFDSKKRRQVIFEKGFALDNPAYEAFAKVVSATTNIPIDRLFYKMKNIEGALNEDNDLWQRIAMLAGWPEWQLKDKEKEPEATPEQKEKAKAAKAIANYKAAKGSTDYDTLKKLTASQQIKMLKGLGYGEYTIKNAKSEKAKIDLIIHKNSGGKIKVDKKAEDTAKYKALNKAEQVAKLDSLGLSDAEIKALKYEQDRVDKLLELMK